jgi:two-component system chemotaxis sensor kinase CheA
MNVERVMRAKQEEISTVENREVLQINGHSLSLVHLADVLGLPHKRTTGKSGDFMQVVVLASGGERIAFAVDDIFNEQEVLLKGLGKQLARVRNFAGSTVLGSGKLAPFLNVPDLMKSGIEVAATITKEEVSTVADTHRKSILVVEDSITARSLLKNILEASGYQVKTAVDGIDAMTALKTETFDLVVSDVEMPRMDGFDLTAKIRADKKLAELPVILVTALASREHRERGIDAGANAYIVKSDFDQTGLLEIINRFI